MRRFYKIKLIAIPKIHLKSKHLVGIFANLVFLRHLQLCSNDNIDKNTVLSAQIVKFVNMRYESSRIIVAVIA